MIASARKKKIKEADLYSAFIEVPYTQGAQVRITQCYLQTTPYLPLRGSLWGVLYAYSMLSSGVLARSISFCIAVC